MNLLTNLGWDNRQTTRQNIFGICCFLLIITTFFTHLTHFRYFGYKVQPTEILFLLTIPFIPYKEVWQYQWRENATLVKLILIYLAFDLIASSLSHRSSSVMESMGRIYLFVLFSVLAYRFSTLDIDDLIEKITRVFFFGAVLTALIAAYGYLMITIGRPTETLMFFDHYPYFGRLYRLRSFNIYPSLFISIITLPVLYLVSVYKTSRVKNLVVIGLILLLICTALTLSKSILLITLGLIIFALKWMGYLNKGTFIAATVIFIISIVTFTHVIIVKTGSDEEKKVLPTYFTSNKVVSQIAGYDLLETDYLTLKRTEVDLFPKHLFFGVGTGNFNMEVRKYKNRGLFPEKFGDLDPHCTYLGALVEDGIFAFVALLAIFIYIFRLFTKRPDLFKNDLILGLFLIYVTFLIDGIETDIFNFRHLWVFLALAVVCLQKVRTAKHPVEVA
ncbi:O-antigen ligase family protein [Mucilaginibacter sp. AW1-3]